VGNTPTITHCSSNGKWRRKNLPNFQLQPAALVERRS